MDFCGALEICKKAEKMYPSGSLFQKELQMLSFRVAATQKAAKHAGNESKVGGVFFKAYPFQPTEYLTRKEELIQSTQKAFKAISSNCELLHSPLYRQSATISDSNSLSSSPSDDFYGVFATRDIARGEHILNDVTIFGAASINPTEPLIFEGQKKCSNCYCTIPPHSIKKISSGCCSAVYCSEQCKNLALDFYHTILCQQNFRWLFDENKNYNHMSVLDGLLWLRTLAICVESDCHPLDHPQIARLTPQYKGAHGRAWSLENNIVQPIRILLQLGIDVFRDPRYDTWALQTVQARFWNNSYGSYGSETTKGLPMKGIASLYSFFNHSCEPNAGGTYTGRSPSSQRGGTSQSLSATRAIQKGEEIFISYVSVDLNFEERQRILRVYFGGHDCRCSKCERGN